MKVVPGIYIYGEFIPESDPDFDGYNYNRKNIAEAYYDGNELYCIELINDHQTIFCSEAAKAEYWEEQWWLDHAHCAL